MTKEFGQRNTNTTLKIDVFVCSLHKVQKWVPNGDVASSKYETCFIRIHKPLFEMTHYNKHLYSGEL
jgi:hypothetical protein